MGIASCWGVVRDLRLAVRTLWRQPGFTALTVGILALGLGAATAMFSMVNALALRPLPYPDAESIVHVQRSVGGRTMAPTRGAYREYLARNTVFEALAPFGWGRHSLSEPGQPAEDLWSLEGSAELFSLLGASPLLGRLFHAEEHRPGGDRAVLLSARFWQSRFAGDPGILGRRLHIDGIRVTVVGVLPAQFSDPTLYWSRVDAFLPLALPPPSPNDHQHGGLQLFARLKAGVTREAALVEIGAIAATFPDAQRTGSQVVLQSLRETSSLSKSNRRVVWLSLGLGVLVLLIACVNLAGVQLSRLAGRGQEHAIRLALGASRGRLVRQMLLESLLLSAAGGSLGTVLAAWCAGALGPRLIVGIAHTTIGVPASLDGRVVAAALAMVLVTALVVGTVPAWLSSGVNVSEGLKQGSRRSTERSQPRLRQALVVGEMALALSMLAAGGLFLRGLHLLVAEHPGWTVAGLSTATVNLPAHRYETGESRRGLLERLESRLSQLPGVQQASLSSWLPLVNFTTRATRDSVIVESAARPATEALAPIAYFNSVSASYFATLGLPVREGRRFDHADRPDALPVAVVNQSMAERFWPGQSPIGKRIANAVGPPHWRTVVGVVDDVRFAGSLEAPVAALQIYQPLAQATPRTVVVSLRGMGAPEAQLGELRRLVAEVDTNLSISDALAARALLERSLTNLRMTGWILSAFAGLGLLLAALGVYGLFAGFVVDRTREIGVRVALGAQSHQVLWLVMRGGVRLSLLGALFGLAGAAATGRLLRSVTPELPGGQAVVVVALSVLLVLVALLACWLPARRAAALDPMVALRQE